MWDNRPAHWTVRRLSDVTTRITRKNDGTGHPVMTISAKRGFMLQSDKFSRDMAGKSEERYILLRKGEFAYNKGNSLTAPQGCIFRLENESAVIPFVYYCFAIGPDLDADFALHAFQSGVLNRELARAINSGVRNDGLLNLPADDFFRCQLALPPLPEQRAIADILGAVETAISTTERLVDELKARRSNLINIFDKPTLVGRKAKLRSIIKSITAGVSVSGEIRTREEHEFGVLRTSSVSSGIFLEGQIKVISTENVSRASTNPKADCIIFSRANTPELVGASAYVKNDNKSLFLSDKLWQIDVNDRSVINVRWLSLALAAPRMRQMIATRANGTSNSMQNISKSAFLSLEVVIPPIEIQNAIAEIADAFEERQIREQAYLEALRAFREALAQELLSGRLCLPQGVMERHRDSPERAA